MISLEIDLDPLWASINQFFPIMFAILVVPAGIAIAIALANFLIDKVKDAFR